MADKVTVLLTQAEVADVLDSVNDRLEHVETLINEDPPGASMQVLRQTRQELQALVENISEQADVA